MGGVRILMPHYNTDNYKEGGLVWVCGSSVVLCAKERTRPADKPAGVCRGRGALLVNLELEGEGNLPNYSSHVSDDCLNFSETAQSCDQKCL